MDSMEKAAIASLVAGAPPRCPITAWVGDVEIRRVR
jgi:hypothetical protein